jgi:hypothetical protein
MVDSISENVRILAELKAHVEAQPPPGAGRAQAGAASSMPLVHFVPGSQVGETEVREVMKIPFGKLGRAALGVIGKFPAEEVSSNLHRLKEIMETGRVTDTGYSVAGKFAQR